MMPQTRNVLDLFEGLNQYLQTLQGAEPVWLTGRRKAALARFTATGLPTLKDEEWKYTALTPLTSRRFQPAAVAKAVAAVLPERYVSDDDLNLVFVDGVFAPDLSVSVLPEGLRLMPLRQALKAAPDSEAALTRYILEDSAAFIALNEVLWYDGAWLEVAPKAVINPTVHIIHLATARAAGRVLSPRTVIRAGQSSECTVLESHLSVDPGAVYFTNALTDIAIAENATLRYIKAQAEGAQAVHIGATRVGQERSAHFEGFSLSAGALLTRNDLGIVLNGEGADAILHGLYAVDGQQHVDNHTAVEHRVPNATSNQLYKGVLNGAGRSVFNGKIFVRPIAQGTNSYQLNKNLVLGQDCRVDTKPQLEIFADDVKCTHGATIGQLNEEEIFYLQTRAVGRRAAVKMLAQGFVEDGLTSVRRDDLRARLHQLLEPTFAAL